MLTAGITILSLTACGGGSNTISSLTDSDTTTSSVASAAGAALAGTTAASAPEITPSVVAGTALTPSAASTASPAAGSTASPAAGSTTSTAALAPSAGTQAGTSSALGTSPSVESEAEPAPAEEEEEFVPAGEGNTGRTTTDVRFRSEPDADNGEDNVIDELDEGTELIILGREGDFYKVQVDDVVGYVHSDYVE